METEDICLHKSVGRQLRLYQGYDFENNENPLKHGLEPLAKHITHGTCCIWYRKICIAYSVFI